MREHLAKAQLAVAWRMTIKSSVLFAYLRNDQALMNSWPPFTSIYHVCLPLVVHPLILQLAIVLIMHRKSTAANANHRHSD